MAGVKKFSDFNKIYDAVLENAREAAVAAANKAAKKIFKDMKKEALNTLKYYYADYDPDYYDRTNNLYDNALSMIYEDHSTNNTVDIVISAKFSADSMGKYSRKGKAQYGVSTEDWVVDQFLEGIHPNTGKAQDNSRMANFMMQNFIDNKVEDLVDKYMNEALLHEFTKRMK